MEKEKFTVKKALILILSLAAVGVFMWLEVTRYDGLGRYVPSANLMYEMLGMNKKAATSDSNITILLYSVFGAFCLLAWFLTELYPRSHSLQGKKRTVYWRISGVLLGCAAVHMLMCRQVYKLLVPKWGVVMTPQSWAYQYLPITNLYLVSIWLALCIFLGELPSAVKNRKRIFTPGAVKASFCRYLLCILITILTCLITCSLLAVLDAFNPEAIQVLNRGFSTSNKTLARVFVSIFCAPLFEELAFRGLIFGKLKKQIPTWCALLFSAVCFGVWHMNLGQFVYTIVMGIIFALMYQYTSRLRYPMFAHWLNNLISTITISHALDGILPRILILTKIRGFMCEMDLIPALLCLVILAGAFIPAFALLKKVGKPYSQTGKPDQTLAESE